MDENSYHESVMVREALEALHVQNKAQYIDATVGTGGHAVEIGKRGGFVLGIDLDKAMLGVARRRLSQACPTSFKAERCYSLARGNFKDIDKIAPEHGFEKVAGIVFDLGVSNIHLTSGERGFSFGNPEAPLDMRIDPESQGVTGSDLLNALRNDQLVELFSVTMDPGSARWLSRKVIEARERRPIASVGDFLEICDGLRTKPGINPATLPFLALRVAVNSELENLKEALPKAYGLLGSGGKLVVISFHSGEDAIVKDFFRESGGKILTDKPVYPSEDEISKNPKARSAKMRVLERYEKQKK